jgi:DNA-binding NarL/FixJ family response regulator
MMRLLLAEDHTLVRAGMRMLLETIPDIEVVAEAANGAEAIRLIAELRPDCVLMDVAMPVLSGLEALRRSTLEFPETRILIVSMHADEAHVQSALTAGAAGYLLKGATKAELEHALRVVARGQTYLSPAISKSVVDALSKMTQSSAAASALAVLTPRQVEVLRYLAHGESTKGIANRLGLSTKTVEAHRAAIMSRLGIRDLAGLVRLAVREGLVDAGR